MPNTRADDETFRAELSDGCATVTNQPGDA